MITFNFFSVQDRITPALQLVLHATATACISILHQKLELSIRVGGGWIQNGQVATLAVRTFV